MRVLPFLWFERVFLVWGAAVRLLPITISVQSIFLHFLQKLAESAKIDRF